MQSSQTHATTGRFEIRVKGESSIALPAERASLSFSVRTTDLEKTFAAADVMRTAPKVESLLRKLSNRPSSEHATNPPIDHWTRTSLKETSNIPYDSVAQKHLPTKYTAAIDFEARFHTFHAIGDFIASMADLPNVFTSTVEWKLQEETKRSHRSSLRVEAAKNAHQKALDYATALGYKSIVPLVLQEGKVFTASTFTKGASSAPTESVQNSSRNMTDIEAWEEVGEPQYQYQPEDIKMSLAIDVSFYANTE